MSNQRRISVGSYELEAGRCYDRETHLWIEQQSDGRVRCGFDPLGAETSGDIVAVSFEPLGNMVERGGSFGSLEAAKFVGPLLTPVSGTLEAYNDDVLANPALLNADPQGQWMVEIAPDALDRERALLLCDEDEIREWFLNERKKLEQEGMLAT